MLSNMNVRHFKSPYYADDASKGGDNTIVEERNCLPFTAGSTQGNSLGLPADDSDEEILNDKENMQPYTL